MRWPAASRTISRSPCHAASGWGSTSCTRPVRPGARVSAGIPAASLTSLPAAACPPRPAPASRPAPAPRLASSCTARPSTAPSWPPTADVLPSSGAVTDNTSPSSTANAAGLDVVPMCTCTRVPLRSARGSSCQRVSSTSRRSDTMQASGCTSQCPRCNTWRSIPATLTAQRWPACAVPVLRFWACSERTRRPAGPPGSCSSTSPTCT